MEAEIESEVFADLTLCAYFESIATLMQFAARDHQAQADFEDPVGTTVSLGVLPPYHTMGLMVNILGFVSYL